MIDRETALTHLRVIRTWNTVDRSFAYDEADKREKKKTVEWLDEIIKWLEALDKPRTDHIDCVRGEPL